MNWRSFPAPLLCGALLLTLAPTASAVPHPPKPNHQAALLQQHAKTAAQQHLLSQAAAARQHQLLAIHAQTSGQLLLKTHENFFKQHIIEEANRPVPPPPFYGYEYGDRILNRAPVTRIEPGH